MSELARYTCDEVLRRLDDYVDRALDSQDIRRIERHLADCVACAEAARFETSLIARIRGRLSRIAVPAGLREKIHARLTDETSNRGDRRDLSSGGP